jgi:hypothetical protein
MHLIMDRPVATADAAPEETLPPAPAAEGAHSPSRKRGNTK